LTEIIRLPENLVNKIAAGEVVERPASVVKELVENSLDAGASRIRIEIEEGGIKKIKVTDDGQGIGRDFLPLALTRHATSKLTSADQLDSIASLGFRGEALPSIASVSMFEIVSKPRDQLAGYKLKIEGGREIRRSEAGAPDGTTIEVRELFFNTPARRKFLKTQVTETRHVIDVINGLALAFPECGFELTSEGRNILALNRSDSRAERVRDLLGANDFERMIDYYEETEELTLAGFTIRPEFARKNRAQLYFIVNNRRISSPLLYSALMKAYGEFLPHRRYPLAVIYLDLKPWLVDVNVSPTKSEVRFSDERAVFHALMSSVRKALTRDDVIPQMIRSGDAEDGVVKSEPDSYRMKIRRAAEKFFSQKHEPVVSSQPELRIERRPGNYEVRADQHLKNWRQEQVERVSHESPADKLPERKSFPHRMIQFADLFIVAFTKDRLMVVDQHAAHERVLYERALKSFDKQKMTSQKLLFPVNIELEPYLLSGAEEYFEILRDLGFELERFGPRSLAVYAVPAVVTGKNPESLVKDLIGDLLEYEKEAPDRFKLTAQMFACRAAIKAGDRLSEEMMSALLEQLFKCENPYICPHGRPTVIRMSAEELRERFGR
jgi:DNA mismatch repair protein MutL